MDLHVLPFSVSRVSLAQRLAAVTVCRSRACPPRTSSPRASPPRASSRWPVLAWSRMTLSSCREQEQVWQTAKAGGNYTSRIPARRSAAQQLPEGLSAGQAAWRDPWGIQTQVCCQGRTSQKWPGSLPICQSNSLTVWQSDSLTVWQSDSLTVWQSEILTVWQSDSLTVWQSGSLGSGSLVVCQSGSLAV